MSTSPAVPHVPDEVSVVEVYGSKFLLEWLDREVLASAAAQHLADPAPAREEKAASGGRPRGSATAGVGRARLLTAVFKQLEGFGSRRG
jgi:hypothetical protein